MSEHNHNCNCGHEDCNCNEETVTVTLTLDNDEEVECAVLVIYTVDEQDYIALLPIDENGEKIGLKIRDKGEEEEDEIFFSFEKEKVVIT